MWDAETNNSIKHWKTLCFWGPINILSQSHHAFAACRWPPMRRNYASCSLLTAHCSLPTARNRVIKRLFCRAGGRGRFEGICIPTGFPVMTADCLQHPYSCSDGAPPDSGARRPTQTQNALSGVLRVSFVFALIRKKGRQSESLLSPDSYANHATD